MDPGFIKGNNNIPFQVVKIYLPARNLKIRGFKVADTADEAARGESVNDALDCQGIVGVYPESYFLLFCP